MMLCHHHKQVAPSGSSVSVAYFLKHNNGIWAYKKIHRLPFIPTIYPTLILRNIANLTKIRLVESSEAIPSTQAKNISF